jgi:hypothetical protein
MDVPSDPVDVGLAAEQPSRIRSLNIKKKHTLPTLARW